jgi:hypothetical protein
MVYRQPWRAQICTHFVFLCGERHGLSKRRPGGLAITPAVLAGRRAADSPSGYLESGRGDLPMLCISPGRSQPFLRSSSPTKRCTSSRLNDAAKGGTTHGPYKLVASCCVPMAHRSRAAARHGGGRMAHRYSYGGRACCEPRRLDFRLTCSCLEFSNRALAS